MVRAKSVLNMMMMSFLAMGLVTIIWVLFGFSLAFGDDVGAGLIGDLGFLGLGGTLDQTVGAEGSGIPLLAFAMFQLTFAIITAALLSGAVADRVRIRAWVVFIAAWSIVVYPRRWRTGRSSFHDGAGGWIGDRLGALDFAGGTAVEINSGFSSLALAIVVGRRIGWRRDPMRPHNLPLVLLGAGILWFGWFGFNAGSALAANGLAATALINTQISTACAALTWVVVERLRDGKATTLGVASGAVAGAVAITPACGFVTPVGALVIGLAAGAICSLAIGLKYRFGFDDSLDVLGVHGVGGIVGMIAIGLFATVAANGAGADGLFYGGVSACWADSWWRRSPRWRLPSQRPGCWRRSSTVRSGSASPRTTRSAAWTSPSTLSPHTTSSAAAARPEAPSPASATGCRACTECTGSARATAL